MSLDVFQAYVAGISDARLDQQLLAVQTGYWAGYYGSGSKHLKSVKKVSEEIIRSHKKASTHTTPTIKPDVDVDAFIEREARFKAILNSGGEQVNAR